MATTTNLNSLVINYLTQAQYDAAAEGGTLNENQLYLTPTGITAADISRWNSKSDTDEKVKTEVAPNESIYVVGSSSSNTTTSSLKKVTGVTVFDTPNTWTNGTSRIILGNSTSASTEGGKQGSIQIYGNGQYYVLLQTPLTRPGITANRTIILPDKAGTVALISDVSKTQLIRWTEV